MPSLPAQLNLFCTYLTGARGKRGIVMFLAFKNRNFIFMLLGDACLMTVAYYLAYCLRFDWSISSNDMANFSRTVIWIVPIKLICFYVFGPYKGMWRYTGIEDLKNLTKACVVSSGIIVAILLLSVRFVGFPRSIFPIDLVLTFLMTGALRIGIRLYYHREKAEPKAFFLAEGIRKTGNVF